MIVFLQSRVNKIRVAQLDVFVKEIEKFPIEIKEELFILVEKFINGERLNTNQFKSFKLGKTVVVQEFKVKDHTGNWRAISSIIEKETLLFIHAFHKKSQALPEKQKNTIRQRIKRVKL